MNPDDLATIIDSTKLKAFQKCPRAFFYEYILHWTPDHSRVHLNFGEAWHSAMESLLSSLQQHGSYEPGVEEAMKAFLKTYHRYFSVSEDGANAPKDSKNALQALAEYVLRYEENDKMFKVLYTEVAGRVPIDANRWIHFKIDAILQGPGGVVVMDHKTSGQMYDAWKHEFTLSVQIGTYIHLLNCIYDDNVYGAIINGAFFRKKGNDFLRVPLRYTSDLSLSWLTTVRTYLQIINDEYDLLTSCTESDDVMIAFPLNPQSCCAWFHLCPYHALCSSWANPLQHTDRGCPPGFIKHHWDPREQEERAKFVFNGDVIVKKEIKDGAAESESDTGKDQSDVSSESEQEEAPWSCDW